MDDTFYIDVWSDVVCPFCYLGSVRLAHALEQIEHREVVAIRHRAFELDPRAPLSYNRSLDELLAQKYATTTERISASQQHLANEALTLGLHWSLERAQPGNSFDAHRLIALSTKTNQQGAMSERLFRAYFSEGRRISDRDTLIQLADEIGVAGAGDMLESDDYTDDVRADESEATELGITGVPSMVLDGKFMVVGAQPTESILNVLNRAWTRRFVSID